VIKEVLMNMGGGSFEKARDKPLAKLLFGLNGEDWALHKRIANQAFMIELCPNKSSFYDSFKEIMKSEAYYFHNIIITMDSND
jgi:hypothetical protein